MTVIQPLVTPFTLTGQLEDLVIKSDNCVKSLQLITEQGEYEIKIAKEIRRSIGNQLQPGCLLKIAGMRKNEIHKGQVKYKAYRIELLSKPLSAKVRAKHFHSTVDSKPKAKVLFCQKSTCWKRGGKAACQLLQTELENRGISEQVEVKMVGCLKQCKKAPNIVIMPDKAFYHRVNVKQVSKLIEKHLSM